MINPPTLMILGAGVMQIPVLKAAKEHGYNVLAIDFDPNAPGIGIADTFDLVSTLDIPKVLEIAKHKKIAGLLTTSDAPVKTVASVAHELGLIGMSVKTSDICTNKFKQRELFRAEGINCPKYRLVASTSDLTGFDDFPYIVKPIDSSASRGVKKVENENELRVAVTEALNFSNSGHVIIESFIHGREFSVETLTQHGKTHIIAITEKLTRGEEEGFFVEDTHIEPARISGSERELIEAEVKKAISAIGMNNCPSHTEIKVNEKGAFIIEIACRLGGDYITSDLVPLSTGVDMLGNLIKLAIGEEIDIKQRFSKCACVQFLNPDNYEKCRELINSDNESIVRSEVLPYEDKKIRNSMDRLGYVILQTETVGEMEEILKKINI